MRLTIDTDRATITRDAPGKEIDLYSDAGFELLSDLWLKVGWQQRYSYSFTWLGAPIIQLPEDMIRYQEVVFQVKPDVIVETGIAHGGSLIYSASLLALLGKGRVVGVDVDIRPATRARVTAHPLAHLITMVEGSSVAPQTLAAVRREIHSGETVLVVLDSDHSYGHVRDELNAYHDLVTPGSFIIATDGVMRDLADVPRGQPGWTTDNPARAAEEFQAAHPEFEIVQPAWPFNESTLTRNVTYWPSAYLRRR